MPDDDPYNIITYGPDGEEHIDEAKFKASARQIRKDSLYLEAHRAQWMEQYPDMYVAVFQEKLVAAATTVDGLVEQLEAKGVPAGYSCWQFLDTDPMDLVVPG